MNQMNRSFFRWEIGVYAPAVGSSVLTDSNPQQQQQHTISSTNPQMQQQQQMSHQTIGIVKSHKPSPNSYKTIISNSRIHILENASLVIKDVSKFDEGFYLCQAANNFGSLSALIKLTVNGKLVL